MHEELSPAGLTVFGVALDRSADDIRPYLERQGVTFPAVLDPEHRVAELYGIINIPTVVWIDEAMRIVRPPRIEPATNLFQSITGLDCEPHLAALRHWVATGETDLSAEEVRSGQIPPTRDEQLARAEFTLAWHLEQHGQKETAERHFARADQLAPNDWTIRRGSMPIRGMDPMGNEFFAVWQEWEAAGKPDYKSIAAERRRPKAGGG